MVKVKLKRSWLLRGIIYNVSFQWPKINTSSKQSRYYGSLYIKRMLNKQYFPNNVYLDGFSLSSNQTLHQIPYQQKTNNSNI